MAGRSAKYNMGRRDEPPFMYHGIPPPPPGMGGPPPPPFGSHYDGPGAPPPPPFAPGPHDLGGLPPPPRRGNVAGAPPPMPSIMQMGEGQAAQDSPWEGLNKHQSHKVTSVPAYSSLAKKEAPLYEELINFPRAKDKDDMRCVMCGLPPSELCVIPRQNKDVCKDCDKATWQHRESQVYFKWCKGCKKFLKLSSFSQKLDAAKCDKCRERGRQSYLAKKGKDGEEGGHHMSHHRHHLHHAPHHPPHPHPHHFPHGPPPPHHLLPPPPHHFPHGPPPPPHIRMSSFPGGPGLPPLGPLPPPPGMLHHPPLPHGRHAPFHEGGDYSGGEDDDDSEDYEEGSGEEQKPQYPSSVKREGAAKEGGEDEEEEEAEMDEDDDAADATLSNMKLSSNFHAPLTGSRASGDEGGSAPGTPSGSTSPISASPSSGPVPVASPTPATPQTPRGDPTMPAADSATLSSLIQSSTAEGGNNLAELARIHHRIVELEAKAEQVNSMNKQLQAAHEHNRRADGTIKELSFQLDQARQENAHLHMQLQQWCHHANHPELLASHPHPGHPTPHFAEGGVPVPIPSSTGEEGADDTSTGKAISAEATAAAAAEHVEQAAAEKDKRNRSDSITAGAALLDGFKKQRVDSGLSINTGAASPTSGMEGEANTSSSPSGGEMTAAEGKEKEGIFGEGYETPRHAIKGSPAGSPTIAL